MLQRILIYNSGGGVGDSIQLMPIINTLKSEFNSAKFYYLSAHQNHFNSSLKDFKCEIETLNLDIKYFGFRWWHSLIINKKIKRNNIEKFDLILDFQSKIRNTLILKMLPHNTFISTCFNFKFSKPKLNIKKEKKINNAILNAINLIYEKDCKLIDFDLNKIDKKIIDESKRLLPKNNYIGFSITQGNVYRKKQWPLDKILRLSKEFIKKNKTPVFLVEKKYQKLKDEIKNSIPSALFPEHESNLQSPALVSCLGKRLDLAITIDNGIMHMLSLSKVPMISLFGPTDSEKFAPKHDAAKILDSKKLYNSKNVSQITVEDVVQAAKLHLNF